MLKYFEMLQIPAVCIYQRDRETHRQFCERRIGSLSAKRILLELKKLQGNCGESLT